MKSCKNDNCGSSKNNIMTIELLGSRKGLCGFKTDQIIQTKRREKFAQFSF
jgi:hypothetical protein